MTDHKVNGLNEALEVTVTDEPGQGGACHNYEIRGPQGAKMGIVKIRFQNGPIKEAGVNGISQEALLAILIDRLQGFQSGQYACAENAEALGSIKNALFVLKIRTAERLARGVEGTSVK
jgi:hypothetical protein